MFFYKLWHINSFKKLIHFEYLRYKLPRQRGLYFFEFIYEMTNETPVLQTFRTPSLLLRLVQKKFSTQEIFETHRLAQLLKLFMKLCFI